MSKRLDKFTFAMVLLGALLILSLPMGEAANWHGSHLMVNAVYDLLGQHRSDGTYVESWEFAAVGWSLAYIFLFQIVKFPSAYGAGLSQQLAGRLSAGLGMVTIVVAGLVFILFRQENSGGRPHVAAEVLIVGWAAVEDLIIWLLLSNKAVSQAVKSDYRQFFLIVDGPGLGAMSVVFAFLLMSPDNESSALAAFGSGAAAMDLLLIQICFAGLFLFEGGLDESSGRARTQFDVER